ncbi:shikimate dehydrogenase [Streptococcus ilei]|jgi:shikimate dehydrogenase|uniref:shikimate dehydrogenase n=1 Tax=Streptococcus TaxID=1301 RepID=UPI0003B92C66|nr:MULTISPECIES: shikimate dehydrogenase [Streptococcus]AGY39877.1 shikimate 5-dehydrogenase [Streptococcus ilei]RGM74085.1 shikimate dehydrogenase [Streptococcus ilei]
MRIDGYTRMAAVIAKPIRHSISPFIHNHAYQLTATNAVYLAWEVAEEQVEQSLQQLRVLDMLGANISMPYKKKVLPYLDQVDESAQLIGSVNTIVQKDGCLTGYNTDGLGFLKSLPKTFSIKDKKLVLLGAGGAATAIILEAIRQGVAEIHLFVRPESLAKYQATFSPLSEALSFSIVLHDLSRRDQVNAMMVGTDLLINATGLGMDGVSLPVPKDFTFPKGCLVADLAYFPAKTPFLQLAEEQELQTVNGLGMLFHQAALAFELMTYKTFPEQEVWQALKLEYPEYVLEK